VEVRSCAVKSRAVSNRNCVGVIRGGEQRNENNQSVTQVALMGGRRELDSVGVAGRACERKAKPVSAGLNPRAAGRSPVGALMVGDGMAGSSLAVIRETRRGQAVFMARWPEEPPDGSQSVRSSDEAGNDRGAKGRRKVAAQGTGTAPPNRRQWRQRLDKSTPTAPREGRFARRVRAECRWPQLTAGESADRRGLRRVGRGPWRRHTADCGPSYDYAPTDWRAGCGRSARPVRREGQGSIPGPYLYRWGG
jgi:hypothetical protein